MPTISKKELEDYQQLCKDRNNGRILTPDGLRLVCEGMKKTWKPSGSIFLKCWPGSNLSRISNREIFKPCYGTEIEVHNMPVVQDAFFIPDDIATGLAAGLYRRIGSVVRYAVGPNKGRIVKHLKPIDLKATEEAQGLGVKALQFVKWHKKGTIIAVAGAAGVGTGLWVYNKVKNHEPKIVTEFRAALHMYIDAIREGSMDIGQIDKLMAALEELKKHKDYEKISIQLTTEELQVLVGHIYEYTIKFAEDNNVELAVDSLNTDEMKNSGTIINLQNYLKGQKRFFEAAA